jgi:hypothetical protein
MRGDAHLTFEPGADFDAYLGTLGKKERHELRRPDSVIGPIP